MGPSGPSQCRRRWLSGTLPANGVREGEDKLMAIRKPTMPYAFAALEPHLGRFGLRLHFDLYHKASAEKVNSAIEGSPLSDYSLYRIVRKAWAQAPRTLLAQAREVLNHEFYWSSMTPDGGGPPTGQIVKWIERAYGGNAHFMHQLRTSAMEHPGDGWLWVVLDRGQLKIITTTGTSTPVAYGLLPLLALDLWHHAYDLDYGKHRGQYVDVFLQHLVNWEFSNDILMQAETACSEIPDVDLTARRPGKPQGSSRRGMQAAAGAAGSRRSIN